MTKTYIKRWKQVAFNPQQIEDTKWMFKKPLYLDFPLDCIFSIDKKGDCTFYMESSSIEKCEEFGRRFDWGVFIPRFPLTSIIGGSIHEILEKYFLLEPEIIKGIPEIYKTFKYENTILSKQAWSLLIKKGYLKRTKAEYKFMEILQFIRLLLRFRWEEYYYNKPYKVYKKAINYNLVRGTFLNVIGKFNGKEEIGSQVHYIFNPYKEKTMYGIVHKVDEKKPFIPKKDFLATILVMPNARPELVQYFDIKGLVGFISEEGGATAHSIVIARERNIPCVVGVPGIMKNVKNGDRIEVNMETGGIIVK